MEMRLRAPVTRGYFFLLRALRLVNAASPRNIDQKKISSGTQGTSTIDWKNKYNDIEPWFHFSQGGGIRVGLTTLGGGSLLSEGRYFRKFTPVTLA